MTLVSIDLKNAGYETGPDDRVVFYSPANRNAQGTIISTAETSVPLVDGKASKELAPGPVVVKILAQGVADTREKSGYVPEEGPVSLWDVVLDWTPALVNQGILEILAAVEDAVETIEGAVETVLSAPITPELTSFFQRSTNLVNLAGVLADSTIPEGTGEISPSDRGSWVTAPIPVIGGQEYALNSYVRATFYDADGQYVDFVSGSGSQPDVVTAPPSARTVRLTVATVRLDAVQMNLGPALLPYEPWSEPYLPASILELPDTPDLPDEPWFTVTPGDTSFFERSSNLFDADTITVGFTIRDGNSEPTPNPSYAVSDFIPVIAGEEYTFDHAHRITFLSDSGTYLGHLAPITLSGTMTAPAGATHARLSIRPELSQQVQLNIGPGLLPYEPGGVSKIPARYLSLPTPDSPDSPDVLDPFVVDITGLNEEFAGPELDADTTIDTDTVADVYARYDALMAAHPDYVTRRDLGPSSDGVHRVYAYTFRPAEVPGTVNGEVDPGMVRDLPTGVILSGVHGYEKPAVAHLHRLATMLCEEWEDHPPLEALRWNFELILIPLVNAAEWPGAEGGRHNANGVDLNRNYPTGWVQGTPGTSTYGGTAPLSEPESQAIYALLQEVQGRCVFGLDLHNFSALPERPWLMAWQSATSPLTVRVGKAVMSLLSRRWSARYEWITVPEKFFGYVSPPTVGGTFARALAGLGIPGSTFETSRLTLLDGGPGERHSARAMTLGFEATVTLIAMTARESVRSKRGIPLD